MCKIKLFFSNLFFDQISSVVSHETNLIYSMCSDYFCQAFPIEGKKSNWKLLLCIECSFFFNILPFAFLFSNEKCKSVS